MKIYAISDLHLDFAANRRLLEGFPEHPDDWLVIAGDVSHRISDLEFALDTLVPRYARVAWSPGNHDLWVSRRGDTELRGVAKYEALLELCRERNVLTPEDPYERVEVEGRPYTLAPIFTLYDYSFRPDDIPADMAVFWALKSNVMSTDEYYLQSDPFPSRAEWCAERCKVTEARLAEVDPDAPLIMAGHFPLREDLIKIYIPRFTIWCGTRLTEQWHTKFNTALVISGHLHVPGTKERDGVRFEEVSLGYPRQWTKRDDPNAPRQVMPEPG